MYRLAPLALLLVACGGSEPATIDSLASKVGCTAAAAPTQEMYVKDAAKCEVDGHEVRLLTFETNEARDGFVQVASSFGGTYMPVERGAYGVQGAAAEQAVKAKIG